MKRAGLLMAAVAVTALLFACTRKSENQLTGNWQKQNGSSTICFSQDGKVKLVSGPATIGTLYRLNGKNIIQLDLGILGTSNVKYTLSKDELTLTDFHGKQVKYLRVKKAKTVEKAKGAEETQGPETTQGAVKQKDTGKTQGIEKAKPAQH